MSHFVIAGLRGNAGAGGAMLALAADHVYARSGVVLNPHYRSMGDLYGSEYWTYTLPRRVRQRRALELTLVLQADRHAGGAGDGISRRRLWRGYRGVRGRAEGAGEAPRPGSGIPLDASEEARDTSRRRIRQAPRDLSRRRSWHGCGSISSDPTPPITRPAGALSSKGIRRRSGTKPRLRQHLTFPPGFSQREEPGPALASRPFRDLDSGSRLIRPVREWGYRLLGMPRRQLYRAYS